MKFIFDKSLEALQSLSDVLTQLPGGGIYAQPCAALSNATIGQHTRHIIELYQCLLQGYEGSQVNYDDRKRNPVYETEIHVAIAEIKKIQGQLQQPDKPLRLLQGKMEDAFTVESNYFREVLYNLEHCIHHQALIKVALQGLSQIKVADHFGVAPSTLQHRNQCVQ